MISLPGELVRANQFLHELNFSQIQQIKMCCDNQVAFHIATNLVQYYSIRGLNIEKLTIILFEKSCCPRKFVLSLLKPMINLHMLTKSLRGPQIKFIQENYIQVSSCLGKLLYVVPMSYTYLRTNRTLVLAFDVFSPLYLLHQNSINIRMYENI